MDPFNREGATDGMGSSAEDEHIGAFSRLLAVVLGDGDFPIIGLRMLTVRKKIVECQNSLLSNLQTLPLPVACILLSIR